MLKLTHHFCKTNNNVFYLSLALYALLLTNICYIVLNSYSYETIVKITSVGLKIILATSITLCVAYAAYYFKLHKKIKYTFLKLYFDTFDRLKYPFLVLDKKLNIIFINQRGSADFKLYANKINTVIPEFEGALLSTGKYNFNSLNPNSPEKSALSVDLEASYSNKFVYDDLEFYFTARTFKLFHFKLGMIVEFSFSTTSVPQADPKMLENLRLDMINLMLKNTNNEYLELYNKINTILEYNKVAPETV